MLHWGKGSEHATKASPEGRLFMKYTLTGTSSLSATYHYTEQLPDLRQNYDGNLFTSYRTILVNDHTNEAEEAHRLSVRYQYSQPIKGVFFSLSALSNHTQKHSAYQTSLLPDGNVLARSRQNAEYEARMYMLNARFSKSFGLWKSLLVLSGNYLRNKDAQFNDKTLQDYNLDNYTAGISYSARPLRFLSLELESNWQQTRMKSPAYDSKINHLKHLLKLTFPITNNLYFGVNNALHQSIETDEYSYFSDLFANYTYKRIEFQLNINNLLGKSAYEREFVSSIERNFYRYTLRPREIIGKISFTF